MQDSTSRQKILWMIAAGIVLVAVLLVFSDPWNTLKGTGDAIVLRDPEKVTGIIITGGYDSTFLSRIGTGWILFDKEPVNKVAIENLIFAASHLAVMSINTCDESDLSEDPIKISYYGGKKELLKYELYRVGDRDLIRPEGTDRCYFVSIPGYENASLTRIFSAVPGHYQDHQLIGILPGEIAELDINLPGKSHFIIRQDTIGNYRCFNEAGKEPVPADSLNDHAIRMLLSYFSDISYEQYYDSLDASALRNLWSDTPMAQLVITSQSGGMSRLEIFPWLHNGEQDPDIFRALVIFNGQDRVRIVNYIYLDVLMRGLDHYLQ